MSILIDAEFKALIPPLSADEYAQLEQNCIKDGIRDALVVWKRPEGGYVLIDGHNRYRIAEENNLEFRINEMEFPDRLAVKLWIINNALGKRNLERYDRVLLEDKKRDVLAEQARAKMVSTLRQNADTANKNSCQREKQTREEQRENSTDYKIAKAAGTSEDTVRKVRTIDKYGSPELQEQVRNKEISINKAHMQAAMVKAIEESGNENLKERVREGGLTISQAYNSLYPKQDKKTVIQQAKEEHEDFEKSKRNSAFINMNDIQIDESNKKIIAHGMLGDVEKIVSASEKFGIKYKKKDISGFKLILDKSEMQHLIERITDCIMTLGILNNAIRQEASE